MSPSSFIAGIYVIHTKDREEYFRSLEERSESIIKFGKTPEQIFSRNENLCGRTFLIHRKMWRATSDTLINITLKDKLIPDGVIKKAYTEVTAKKKYPEYFV